jgi:16S rRNA (guanine966-N2)-methyltransferase
MLKGRPIRVPRNFSGRPTTDFAREGLFNMLESLNAVMGKKVLELFSGTGVFSLECLSRGAESVCAVEMLPVHLRGIRENFDAFGFRDASTIRADALKWLKSPHGTYDLIFADPPFDLARLGELPGMVLESGVLREGGLFVLEHPASVSFENTPGFFRTRSFGNVVFSFFRHSPS